VNVCPPTVSVPVRSPAVLAAAANVRLPLPVPEVLLVTISHGSFAVAVQVHDGADAVTAIVLDPPSFGTSCDVGAIVKVHGGGGGAACDTVNVWPAIVSVPLRAGPVFAATAKAMVPFPVPGVPLLTVSHGAFAVAVHAHVLLDAVTATDPEPAVSATFWLVGASVNVQGGGGGGGAACDTVNVWPAMVSVPLRAAPVFAATAKATVPFPVPGVPLLTVSHGAFAVAVHAHVPLDAVTATEPEPAVSATF
jgi:hypothetical protein